MSTPSHEALALTVKLSGHTHCATALHDPAPHFDKPCELCLGDATTIDKELQLPQRNAALLLAQALIDAMAGENPSDDDIVDQLRDVLASIKR